MCLQNILLFVSKIGVFGHFLEIASLDFANFAYDDRQEWHLAEPCSSSFQKKYLRLLWRYFANWLSQCMKNAHSSSLSGLNMVSKGVTSPPFIIVIPPFRPAPPFHIAKICSPLFIKSPHLVEFSWFFLLYVCQKKYPKFYCTCFSSGSMRYRFHRTHSRNEGWFIFISQIFSRDKKDLT